MAQPNDILGMLDLVVRPVFFVKENMVVQVNNAALALMIRPDTDVRELLITGKVEYAEFQGGCLYLTLQLFGQSWGATVTRIQEFDVFLLEQEQEQSELQALALAAQELREPLNRVMTTAQSLFPLSGQDEDPALREQTARLNRGLYQLLRVVGNMSDAPYYNAASGVRMETVDITALFQEIFSKNQIYAEHAGVQLIFTNLNQRVFTLADPEKLERAVLNILSNAIKFSPKGSTIEAKLTRCGSLLRLSIEDGGEGIPCGVRCNVYSRYLRQPAIEDSRYGIGLGMVMIRAAAAQHGGTVLLDQPGDSGTRVTMTIAIRQNTDPLVRSPVFRVDYAGELDHSLVELSDCLPPELYDNL